MPLNDVKETGRLKRLGVIRLGWQEPNANNPGKHAVASDHFVMTDAQFLVPFFGEEPTSLPIYFPYDDFDRNIDASYMIWAGGSASRSGICICQGDGETVASALPFKVTEKRDGAVSVRRAPGDRLVSWGKAAVDFTWGEYAFKEGDAVPCPGRTQDLYPHCAACGASILLKILIRDARAARFGYWQISTGSIANYKHFLSVWDSITGGGRVPIPMSEAPFVLSIAPGSTLFQDKKSGMWASREAFYLQLELDPRVAQLEMDGRERRFVALLEGRADTMAVPQLSAEIATTLGETNEPPWDGNPYEDETLTGDPLLNGDFRGAPMDADASEDYREVQEDEAAPPSYPATEDDKQRESLAANKHEIAHLDHIPGWINDDERRPGMWWGRLYHDAVMHLEFDNDHHVKGALSNIYKQDKWDPATADTNYASAWYALQEHQRSKRSGPAAEEAGT